MKGSEDILKIITNQKMSLPDSETTSPIIKPEYTPEDIKELEEQVEEVHLIPERSLKNQAPYPYQSDGVKFIENANGRALILDEMGLGKTVQALLYIRRNAAECLPCIIFCKPSLMMNWFKECINWVGTQYLPTFVRSGKIDNVFKIYICSIDMAFKKRGELAELGAKTIIIDELQNMKNLSAKRTFAIRKIASHGDVGKPIPHVVGLTGTPIKNRATEFFAALNMVKPDLFPSNEDFIRRWTKVVWVKDVNKRGGGSYKEGGISNLAMFKEFTKDFVIRRLRDEVLPDLPKVDRHNRFVEMDQKDKAVYAKQHKKLEAFMLSKGSDLGFKDYSTILQFITAMRQITALSKVEFACDYINEFLESSDSKITVFTHHHLAIDYLIKLLKVPHLRYRSKDDYNNIEKFNEPGGERVLIASTQSAGEGLNLQYQCHHCLFMERQWNPAIEEQAEGRFTRIGAVSDKVTATYLIALGTIDEWMTELIEFKRVSANVDKQQNYFQDQTTLQIAQKLIDKGLPKWRLPRM